MQLNTDQLKAVLQEFKARYTGPPEHDVEYLTSHHPEFGLVPTYVRVFDKVTYQNIDPEIWGCLRGLYGTKLGISIDARGCRGILVCPQCHTAFPPGHRRRNCPLRTCKKFKLVHEECRAMLVYGCVKDIQGTVVALCGTHQSCIAVSRSKGWVDSAKPNSGFNRSTIVSIPRVQRQSVRCSPSSCESTAQSVSPIIQKSTNGPPPSSGSSHVSGCKRPMIHSNTSQNKKNKRRRSPIQAILTVNLKEK